MLEIKETIIKNYKPLKGGWVSINLWIKQEDLTEEIEKQLKNFWQDETSLAWVLQEFESEKIEDKRPKLLQRLAILITEYCKWFWINEDEEIKKIYSTYNVKSRKDLTENQLNYLIESYELWIREINLF